MYVKRAPARATGGVSMIELIVFIVIVSANVVGILGALSLTTGRSADPLQRKQAILIAEGLLEEVSLARMTFCDPDDPLAETATSAAGCTTAESVGPPPGATRPYANINDYVSAFGVPTSFMPVGAGGVRDTTGTIQDVLGNTLFGGRYRAFVTVTANATLGPSGGAQIAGSGNADTEVLLISVRVLYGNGEQIVLDRFRTRYAPGSTP
ncbi:type II secretion system protein [Massilia sp. PAMC28688]|uniref:type IV pilus modification PilV family protein n=1 Tax=Massilia sp. PAMC28688 TaxID=2861283 RepID=UPI001C631216|nr:type II secretion system protein [Massilia sp. PAMC28688]QYF93319.1 type II secretion system protein [Massilia sp. PAMC28688]